MMAITHTEVRRHPRWREEQVARHTSPPRSGAKLLASVAILIVTTAIGVLMFGG
jgi:hypothetical protein